MRILRFAFPPAIVIAGSLPAHAARYLTVEEAERALFPKATFTAIPAELTDAQARAIEESSKTRVRSKEIRVWRASTGGYFYVDEVLGKHDLITYAVALDSEGAVLGVEILEYRESYGGEIRRAEWRAQFKGKTATSKIELESGIDNISGATLSCRHVTDGVRRILATHAALGLHG